MNFTQPLPLSLYVHYPWCIQKCPYCDFNSHTLTDNQEKVYLDAMIKQLERTLPMVWGRPIVSIFFGGGTPSLISESGLANFISQLRALLGFSQQIEITLEANPGTVDFAKFAGFREAGINRLSLGIQSFDNEKLTSLGRIHSGEEAIKAIEAAQSAGFENFNLDLMFALPNQTFEQAYRDIETAISLAPSHISHYQLTLEPNTPFYRNPPVLPDDDLAWEMQQSCRGLLEENGYRHYEVSAYAQTDKESHHNLNYWMFGDYLGIGAGAHGKITDAPAAKVYRTQMPASPGGYMQMIEEGKQGRVSRVSESEVQFEFMLNVLRLQDGIDLSLFKSRTGMSPEVIEPNLETLRQKKWIVINDDRLELTELGKSFLNNVLQEFLQD